MTSAYRTVRSPEVHPWCANGQTRDRIGPHTSSNRCGTAQDDRSPLGHSAGGTLLKLSRRLGMQQLLWGKETVEKEPVGGGTIARLPFFPRGVISGVDEIYRWRLTPVYFHLY